MILSEVQRVDEPVCYTAMCVLDNLILDSQESNKRSAVTESEEKCL